MPWNSNLRKGTDIPTWDWLSFFPQGNSNPGAGIAYDGSRYLYLLVQTGSTGAASTTTLWRFCTWTDGWQILATTNNSFVGIDLEYDPVRNCLWMTTGSSTTEWRVFYLGTGTLSVLGQSINPYTLTTITTVLPSAASTGASLCLVEDVTAPEPFETGAVGTGSTTTVLAAASGSYDWHGGLIGCAIRMTSGSASGQRRIISAVSSTGSTLTVSSAFTPSAPAAGDTYVIEYPQGTVSSATTSTMTDSTQAWAVNQYANSDVIIYSGATVVDRRRIASNTATVLTLASATTGNGRTGNFAVAPTGSNTYKIVPSSDFLYYSNANGNQGLYKIDLNTGASATTWTTISSTAWPNTVAGGHTIMKGGITAPFSIYAPRGQGTSFLYRYDIGLNTVATLSTAQLASETFTTGAHFTMLHGYNRMAIQKEGATRLYAYRLADGFLEPLGTQPYAAPVGYDGKRMKYLKSADGVAWLYLSRAGGSEFFRLALEHL